MPSLEIHPLSELRDEAARLLGERYARQRALEPLLPDAGDVAAHLPDDDGVVATRGGAAVAYLAGAVRDGIATVGFAGHAATEAEALRDLYAVLAERWDVSRFAVAVPASDGELIDTWFRLAFGCQFMWGVRETEADGYSEVQLRQADRYSDVQLHQTDKYSDVQLHQTDRYGDVQLHQTDRYSEVQVQHPEVQIRASTPDDFEAIAAFDEILWLLQARSPSFSGLPIPDRDEFRNEWRELWDEPELYTHFVADVDGRAVGHALLYRRPEGDLRVPRDNIDLAHAVTLDDVRGTGVGLALTAHVLAWAREQGFRSITADWRSVNLLASRFWPRRGFRPQYLRLYRAVP